MLTELTTWQKAIGAVFMLSLLAATGARLAGAVHLILPCAAPALVVSVWAAFGHLITIDDDLAGGFSNPDGDTDYTRASLSELAIKFAVLAAVLLLISALLFL